MSHIEEVALAAVLTYTVDSLENADVDDVQTVSVINLTPLSGVSSVRGGSGPVPYKLG